MFGTATAAYQVEGAWNEDGKGENIWDHLVHESPELIRNRDNGDVACDSYHKYKDDVALLVDLGVKMYRFSISWSRILPTGFTNQVNEAGVNYYKKLLEELAANNIEPLVTIYHWDLPQPLQDIGGWTNPGIAEHFANYARLLFELYGDSVKYWMTFNEVGSFCWLGYGVANQAPAITSPAMGEYICHYTALKAHALAYHIYDDEFRSKQNGKVTINVGSAWYEPATDNEADQEAAQRALLFNFGFDAFPVYFGNYPDVMIKRIRDRSAKEGFARSRLIELTPEEQKYINGTSDYIATNFYSTAYAQFKRDDPIGTPDKDKDLGVSSYGDPSWPKTGSSWLTVCPWGIRKMMKYLKDTFNDPEIIITENGVSDFGGLNDTIRSDFLRDYLSEVLDSILEDGVNVTGYMYWSLMDNFEWFQGYAERFGLYAVDFQDPERPRIPKNSVEYYKKVTRTRCLVDTCEAEN